MQFSKLICFVLWFCSAKRTVYTRVYIDFGTPQEVLDFKSVFDGHVFVSSRGTQYKCSVEYAPYQKVPRNGKVKRDPREGTIERGVQAQFETMSNNCGMHAM